MAVNKVEFGGETLIDLTKDSVKPETLAEGETAHDAAGEPIIGTMKVGSATVPIIDLTVDFSSLPPDSYDENYFYRYVEFEEVFYAITSTSRNIIKKEYNGEEITMNVVIVPVDTLHGYNSAIAATNLKDNVTLYYQRSDGKVYGAINNIALMMAAQVSRMGWHEPNYIISNYAGVIDDVLDAEYGYVYVVREVREKVHIRHSVDGVWHETVEDYVPSLGEVSKDKFSNTRNENINVSAYRSLNNDYDRVYVESANNSGVSGDYCLTPDATNLPANPWAAASEDKVERLPSIPVRDIDGGISVHTDDDSSPDKAVSKRYFNKNTVQYVRRKPEESSDVANAKLVSAHTWTPDHSLYEKYAETFNKVTSIPTVADVTDKDMIAIFSESNANNSISIDDSRLDHLVDCNHPTSAQSKYRFIRRGTENELVLSVDVLIVPASDLVNNRGFTMVAKNDILADTSIWGGSNLSVEYPKGGSGYTLTFLSQTVSFADYIDKWVNLRIEMDGLGKGSPARLYLNNILKISGELTASVASIKAYDFMIYNWNNSNSGFRGNIYFDNMYFGDIPDTVRYSGYDTLTPIAYDYEDERVQLLGLDTLVTRKPDGSMLTKKELTDEDDDRTAASKYYVDQKGKPFSLPRIRFANCTLIGDEEMGDLMYRFTVENLGGGTLQVGDILQICCKRTYPNKKQKLRMMEEYIITEEDINQRFLKIEVDPSEEGVQKWLYRNNRIGNSSLSAMYFRLKRVTAYGGDDRECNAIFSNIEEVWKTYTIIDGTPSIYSLKIK